MRTLEEYKAEYIASQATGCMGSGSYLTYAHSQGYEYVEVLNWGSSAGDWQFLVSKDEIEWKILFQENNYPQQGFSHSISDDTFWGTFEEVCEQVEQVYTY